MWPFIVFNYLMQFLCRLETFVCLPFIFVILINNLNLKNNSNSCYNYTNNKNIHLSILIFLDIFIQEKYFFSFAFVN